VEDELAQNVEDDVLGKGLLDPHGLNLLIKAVLVFLGFLLGLLLCLVAPEPFELPEGHPNDATGCLGEVGGVLVVFVLDGGLDGFMEFHIDDFLDGILPNLLLLPDPMVIEVLREENLLLGLVAVLAHMEDQLAAVEDGVDHLVVVVFLVDKGREEVLDQIAQGLQGLRVLNELG